MNIPPFVIAGQHLPTFFPEGPVFLALGSLLPKHCVLTLNSGPKGMRLSWAKEEDIRVAEEIR